ncbi:MAG TPA: YcaO-like family protein [Patescibacteria group bacterium]|nr:YcaO-like family protein [Patescibacteria group bacterium]
MKNNTVNTIKEIASALQDIKLVESFQRTRLHYDEPKFWFYSTIINDKYLKHQGQHFSSNSSGVSFFSQNKAVLKSLFEALERYSNFAFFKKDIDFVGRFVDIKTNAINPESFSYFSEKQLNNPEYKKFKINDKSRFDWTKVKLLTDGKEYLVPCQTIYLSYKLIKGEPTFYPSISTGVAAHSDLDSAILGGIYEVIERDSFMIYYLNKLKPKKYNLKSSKNKKIRSLAEITERYHMELYCLDITTDLGIPTVASILIDRSGLSKAVSVGLKSNLNVEKAIIGSINEAYHTRSWIREAYIQNPTNITEKELLESSSMKNRGLLWYKPESISHINFLIKALRSEVITLKNNNLSVKEQIRYLNDSLNKAGYKIYYKDITPEYFKNIHFKAVKVIIPGMQPLYLEEKFALRGGNRLHAVPVKLGYKNIRLNTYPHPFL